MIKYKKFIKLKHSDIQLKSKVIENYLTGGPLPKDPARVFKQILYDLQEHASPEKSMRAVADLFEARKDIELRCVDSSWEKLKNQDKDNITPYDAFIFAMSFGTKGRYMRQGPDLDLSGKDKTPCLFRGLGKTFDIHKCIENKIDYYYIDTGYFGNEKHKVYHRMHKNNMQALHLKKVPHPNDFEQEEKNRFYDLMPKGSYWTAENNRFQKGPIMFAPPSQKVMNFYGYDVDDYIEKTHYELRKYTDDKIIIRKKPGRRERVLGNSLTRALLKNECRALITYNSIAAIEALLIGIPAIVLGQNSASIIASGRISDIHGRRLKLPSWKERAGLFIYLANCQFTEAEMTSGFAWKKIQEYQHYAKPVVPSNFVPIYKRKKFTSNELKDEFKR
tara:strand:+ start:512 stop:1681 length:1170 start_codon:yes stop_codon:yes gene_type:complete